METATESIEQLADRLKTAADIDGVEIASKATPTKNSGAKKARKQEPTVDGAELAPVFQTLGNLAALRWNVRPLDEEETEKLSEAWAPVVEKYAPRVSDHSVELGAILVTLAVVAPRVVAYKAAVQLSSTGQLDAFENGGEDA